MITSELASWSASLVFQPLNVVLIAWDYALGWSVVYGKDSTFRKFDSLKEIKAFLLDTYGQSFELKDIPEYLNH